MSHETSEATEGLSAAPTSQTTTTRVSRRPPALWWVLTLALVATLGVVTVATTLRASAQAPEAGPPATQGTGSANTVTVEGTAVVTGRPDVLRVEFSIQTVGDSVDGALRRANSAMGRVQKVFTDGGVAAEDMQTTGLWINPRHRKSTITGYQVSEDLSVVLRDLETAGALISEAADAGGDATRIHGLEFGIDDNTELLQQARKQAVASARDSALTLAEASGRSLGDAITISETGSSLPQPVSHLTDVAAEVSPVPLQSGLSEVSVRVSVTWELR